jgi:hypothetical protein
MDLLSAFKCTLSLTNSPCRSADWWLLRERRGGVAVDHGRLAAAFVSRSGALVDASPPENAPFD